jgi:pimeloyl-ACP methyl ester carboxylesterase
VEPTFLLVPSVLLGPSTWELTAGVMERVGRRVRRPSLQGVARAAAPYWPAGVDAIVQAAGGESVILVLHSNSGLYAPVVVESLGEHVRGVVFVDAAFPEAGCNTQRDFLAGLVDPDGFLPPWTEWWDESDVAELFSDDKVRARVEAEQQRLPLAYYDHLPPVLDGWDQLPCAYLWFGEPYDEAANRAHARGWATKHVPGQHLHMLVAPEAVAGALLDLTNTWH